MVVLEALRALCLDTDVLIDYLRGPSQPVLKMFELALERGLQLSTTAINAFEVWLGVFLAPEPDRIRRPTEEFLSRLVILSLDYDASVEAGRVLADLRRKGEAIDVRDLLAGCIARRHGYPMVTWNVRHYSRIEELNVLTPEEVIELLE
ncbi:MAG TPA: type II toxin-antitoxin system VapC family toxin [Candidatus Bathyarchaeota archaeon]|nr:MAG: hypothetical protein DRO60_02215 [Candidatus Bathyarchaeota archaeon]HDJ26175.1 type II toxin-antitoxin system VapC family toxin [Candidatus Bathyarchaeota archaeon]